jgi:hypothetical protein
MNGQLHPESRNTRAKGLLLDSTSWIWYFSWSFAFGVSVMDLLLEIALLHL